MNRRALALAALLGCSITLTGCASNSVGTLPPRPALINHPVFFTLKDPSQADELIADCNQRLARIPGIVSYYCGRHFETGRDTVSDDYTVGLFVGFDSAEHYEAYVTHHDHVWLVQKWRPRTEILRVHDILDESR
ncbi:MAG: Dabb family protein [bacterium]|nr:Dabb family protein [bacterium]